MKKTTLLPSHLRTRCACLWAALMALATLAFGSSQAQAAVTEAWTHRYNNVVSNADDKAVKVVSDGAGDIIVTGVTDGRMDDRITGHDMLTVKYSGADGSVLWQKRYNGPANNDDFTYAMAVDSSGNVVLTGVSDARFNRFEVLMGGDYYTAKYAAADGALLWERRCPAGGGAAVAVDRSGNVVVSGYSDGDHYTAKYAGADGTVLWEKRGPDGGPALAVDDSGNVVVTGSSSGDSSPDYYTAKYAAADGALLWEKRYNGPANSDDYPNAVAVDGNGDVVVTGSSYASGSGHDYYTAKYAAADGTLLWEKRYNGPANGGDGASAVALDGNGNVVVTGSSGGSGNRDDYYTAKYAAADGTLLWEKRYNGPANGEDSPTALAVDGSGNVVVTGFSQYQYYTAKYAAADGALLWEKRYNGPANWGDYAQAVVVDGSGNVVVTGFSRNGVPIEDFDYYTAKYAAADGALLWEKRYNGPANSEDSAEAVAVDSSGNVVVTGSSIVSGSRDDYYTAKYASAGGALLWEKRYNGAANYYDNAQAVAVDGGGNVVVAGSSHGGESSNDYYTAKYASADGALLWEKRYDGPAKGGDGASAVAVDGGRNVVVTGYSYASGSGNDYYTAKYAATDGALLWEKRYDGPANVDDYPTALAVDSSGNVVVTGISNGGESGNDYYTAKYASADGALLWEKRYNGPANSEDFAKTVAVDRSGNVVVTGSSIVSGSSYDYYTAKYASEDGALLWERRYNGPANGDHYPTSLAVDSSGNVVVTGSSYGIGSSAYYYTAKYAAADGALLWEKSGPSGGASRVAVDGRGTVVVTGYSFNSSGNTDYYTAKYAAADGALLWEKRYNGPANGNDGASSLALGPSGMVAITGSSIGSNGTYDYATVVYRDTPTPVSFAAWAACSGLTGTAAAANADPDGDGLPNGVEYILGGIPTVPGTSGRPAVTTSGSNMVFTFPRDDASETPGITLTVETGTDLMTWPTVFTIGPTTAASSPGVSITENGAAPDTITVTIAPGKPTSLFARLKVTISP